MQGVWDGVREGLGSVLAFFYSVIPNSGVAIILLTVAVRLALFPLTAKQAKSMIAMQRVQPEIKKLQAKFKNDRQKLNEEMMKFYKENQINPLGGCLPLVLQMPVFIALFQTLQKIQGFIPTESKMFTDICGNAFINNAAKCKPHMSFAGMNLTKSAGKATEAGIGESWPYLVLVVLVMVSGFFQQRQTMRNQTTPNPQMAIISKVFPIVFGFISWGIPSGVVLYFFTSNLWQIGQQEVVLRTIGSAAGPPTKKRQGPDEDPPSDKTPRGGRTLGAGNKPGGSGPGKSNGSSQAKPSGRSPSKPSAKSDRKPDAKPSGKAQDGKPVTRSPDPSNGNASTRGSGGARSNRKRKR